MKALVAIIVGSESDDKIVQESGIFEIFEEVGILYSYSVISAHRHPEKLRAYCGKVVKEGVEIFIGIAGMAAHLAGAIAAQTKHTYPVIGVALSSLGYPDAKDAFTSMSRMPSGCPVGVTTGIDKVGVKNAALFACQILSLSDEKIKNKFKIYQKKTGKNARIDIRQNQKED